jgi:hypothetical protein
MAWILFKAVDNSNPDPIVDARGCYKFGDPVVVAPDTQKFGNTEGLPSFLRVRVEDTEVDDIRHLLEDLSEQEAPLDNEGQPTSPNTLIRKRYGFALDQLPTQYRDTLFATGVVELPLYILERVITHKE